MRERYQKYEAADSPASLLSLINTGMQKHLENMVEIYPLLVQALFSDQESGKKLYQDQIQPLIEARTELVRKVAKDTIDPKLIELAGFGIFFAVAMERDYNKVFFHLTFKCRHAMTISIKSDTSTMSRLQRFFRKAAIVSSLTLHRLKERLVGN